jgi:hypothetical protein
MSFEEGASGAAGGEEESLVGGEGVSGLRGRFGRSGGTDVRFWMI